MRAERIAEPATLPNHQPEADYFNQLILDLKKQLLGFPHEAITLQRLDEGTKHVFSLDQCRREMRKW